MDRDVAQADKTACEKLSQHRLCAQGIAFPISRQIISGLLGFGSGSRTIAASSAAKSIKGMRTIMPGIWPPDGGRPHPRFFGVSEIPAIAIKTIPVNATRDKAAISSPALTTNDSVDFARWLLLAMTFLRRDGAYHRTRRAVEAYIEPSIGLLDEIDEDADVEDTADAEPNDEAEPDQDVALSLGCPESFEQRATHSGG